MKLVRSDSPEVARCIASGGALGIWGSMVVPLCIANALGLLIAVVMGVMVSVWAAVWLGVPVFIALNVILLWRGRSPRLNWVLAGCPDRVYVRLFVRRMRSRGGIPEPDVIMFETSDVASISTRTLDVYLYGPKPKIIERLVIEPVRTIAEDISKHIPPLLMPEGKQVFVTSEEGRLTVEWRWCRPALQVFLQQFARECPSVVIAPKQRSELDLNGIWHGISTNLDAQQRQMLVQAERLGFGSKCMWLLIRYKYLTYQEAAAYLAKIEREEAGRDSPAVQRKPLCGCGGVE
jgi:hypothetical protein